MTENVVYLPSSGVTPSTDDSVAEAADGDTAYILELEQDILDHKIALAAQAKQLHTQQWFSNPLHVAALVLGAFLFGWLLDPPFDVHALAASARVERTAAERPAPPGLKDDCAGCCAI